jgi:D-alanyl-lipoteichoic acid acyltransferase DltB (MBOAT superfamily)
MLFNSGVFLQFFAAVLLLYWLARNSVAARNLLFLVASYIFYGWWAPASDATANSSGDSPNVLLTTLWHCRFLGLLIGTSLLDYLVARGLDRFGKPRARQLLLAASIVANLGVLGFFKYADFLVESVSAVLTQLGVVIQARTLGLVLPVGISFYTFQSMSYTIDVYRRELPATRHLFQFLAYVSFFPQLVAGPIERAKHLLPQFGRTVVITTAMLEEGVWLILWGFFKKVVIADNLAPLADLVYGDTRFTAPAVLLGTLAFALQIYCDFSGYSDIARGLARVLGFDIMWNFDLPYAASSLREFWRRWHISLSSWLRDYLYIPLGGNRLGSMRTYLNLMVTMLLGGLWHGAAWNFVLWGLWHGLGLAVQRAWSGDHPPPAISKTRRTAGWIGTLLFVLYGWLLFRARSFTQIADMTRGLLDWSAPEWTASFLVNLVAFGTPLVCMELWQFKSGNRLIALTVRGWAKTILQGTLLIAIVMFWERKGATFIYFQF